MKLFLFVFWLSSPAWAGVGYPTRDCVYYLSAHVETEPTFTPLSRLDGAFGTTVNGDGMLLIRLKEGTAIKLPRYTSMQNNPVTRFDREGVNYEILTGPILEIVSRRGELALDNPGAAFQVIHPNPEDEPRLEAELTRRAPVLRAFFENVRTLHARAKAKAPYARAAEAVTTPLAPVAERAAERLHERRNPRVRIPSHLYREVRFAIDPAAPYPDPLENRFYEFFAAYAPRGTLHDDGLAKATLELANRIAPEKYASNPELVTSLNLNWSAAQLGTMSRFERLAYYERAWRALDALMDEKIPGGRQRPDLTLDAVERRLEFIEDALLTPDRWPPLVLWDGDIDRNFAQVFGAAARPLRAIRPVNLLMDSSEGLAWFAVERSHLLKSGSLRRAIGDVVPRDRAFGLNIRELLDESVDSIRPEILVPVETFRRRRLDTLLEAAYAQRPLAVVDEAGDQVLLFPTETQPWVDFQGRQVSIDGNARRSLERFLSRNYRLGLSVGGGARRLLWRTKDQGLISVTYRLSEPVKERPSIVVRKVEAAEDANRYFETLAGRLMFTDIISDGDVVRVGSRTFARLVVPKGLVAQAMLLNGIDPERLERVFERVDRSEFNGRTKSVSVSFGRRIFEFAFEAGGEGELRATSIRVRSKSESGSEF